MTPQVTACIIMITGYASSYLLMLSSMRLGRGAEQAERLHRTWEARTLDACYRVCLLLSVICIIIGTWGLAKLVLEF